MRFPRSFRFLMIPWVCDTIALNHLLVIGDPSPLSDGLEEARHWATLRAAWSRGKYYPQSEPMEHAKLNCEKGANGSFDLI